jgi:hypothetical protein
MSLTPSKAKESRGKHMVFGGSSPCTGSKNKNNVDDRDRN